MECNLYSNSISDSSSVSRAPQLFDNEPYTSHPFPILSWSSSDSLLIDQLIDGTKHGVMLLTDLNLTAPMIAIRETFCKLYAEPDFVNEHLNKLHQLRGPFKHKGYLDRKHIDQKAVLDLSSAQIREIKETNLNIGSHFTQQVLPFHERVMEEIIPRLKHLSFVALTGGECIRREVGRKPAVDHVKQIHSENNVKLRLVDFYPVHRTRTRCGAHRDFTTFTLIFQDKTQGGLEVFTDEKQWIPVPKEAEVVFMWGWSAMILSNNRVRAPLHRVVPSRSKHYKKCGRRNEAVFYVAPDWDAFLHPVIIYPNETLKFKINAIRELTARGFKNLFEMKWHKREGTMTEQEKSLLTALNLDKKKIEPNTQDDDIIDYLMGTQVELP